MSVYSQSSIYIYNHLFVNKTYCGNVWFDYVYVVMLQDASDFNFDADPTSFLSGGMKEKTTSNNTNGNSQVRRLN